MAVTGEEREGLFATKPVDALAGAREDDIHTLQRAVGALDLTALGLGAIIGTGIFVILGEAIGDAGPAIVLSFVLAGVTRVFSALSFAELASAIPRVPFVPVFPIIGILLCGYLMKYLDGATWLRFVVWLIAGLAIYVAYGRSHSLLRQGKVVNPEAELDEP